VRFRSLRARLIAATLAWTLGLLFAAVLLAHLFLQRHPRSALFLHNSLLIFLGAVLITAGVSVIRRGMSPFVTLRERLGAVRDGRSARLEGDYPSEVEPLVHDLNALLVERDARVSRAVAKAGDLAHGLKTPLAILLRDVERAEAAGQRGLAASMREQVHRMRRQIDSHLAQARATARGAHGARADVAAAAHAIARAMDRLYAERALDIRVEVPPGLAVRVPAEDLEEMLGNLVDNACKWTTTRVTIGAAADEGRVAIDVDDDGSGLEPAMRDAVLRRGVRADERAPGSGLGLAIVRDLAAAYGGTIALDASPNGGLRARLTLPAADQRRP
jgi:signal transduction histidine kinase